MARFASAPRALRLYTGVGPPKEEWTMSEAARQKTVTEAGPAEIARTFTARAYAAASPTAAMAPFTIPRRAPGPHDVQIELLYCGVCH
jgi:hypothetical protein